MAHKQKGLTVPPPQWWKHLRDWKRLFWRKQRASNKELVEEGLDEREEVQERK